MVLRVLRILAVLGIPAVLAAQTRAPAFDVAQAAPSRSRGAKTHRLETTPATIAYGYYWSEAKPALRIASGDIIDVDTLLTNTPMGLERAGLPASRIQDS